MFPRYADVTPRTQKIPKISFLEKYAGATKGGIEDRILKHGPSGTTVDGIKNSQKFLPRKIG